MRTIVYSIIAVLAFSPLSRGEDKRTYENKLKRIDPKPILADHPEYFEPLGETVHYESPVLVDDADANIDIRAWRFNYNARGIIEIPNHLDGKATALIVVHPWGVDDGQGWRTPEPAGVVDFCTVEKNDLSHEHIVKVLNPFLKKMRSKVHFVMYSQPGNEDPIRKKMYRSFRTKPTDKERAEGAKELHKKLNDFDYNHGGALPETLELSKDTPSVDYFKQFPGIDSSDRYDPKGFWELPIPVVKPIDVEPDDVLIYDAEGYPALKDFLKKNGIRHVILTGYCADMCFKGTTAGYMNLSQDFDTFLVADATLATFPSNRTPRFATNATISYAALDHLITQVSWVKLKGEEKQARSQ